MNKGKNGSQEKNGVWFILQVTQAKTKDVWGKKVKHRLFIYIQMYIYNKDPSFSLIQWWCLCP